MSIRRCQSTRWSPRRRKMMCTSSRPRVSRGHAQPKTCCSSSRVSTASRLGDVQSWVAGLHISQTAIYLLYMASLCWVCDLCAECRIRDGVKGIHLTLNRQGKPNGQAFIEMEHEEDVSKALEKHRHYLGLRYVEGFSFFFLNVLTDWFMLRVLIQYSTSSCVPPAALHEWMNERTSLNSHTVSSVWRLGTNLHWSF